VAVGDSQPAAPFAKKIDRSGSKYQGCATTWRVCGVWHGVFVVFHVSRTRKSTNTLQYVASVLFQRYLFEQDALAKETRAFGKRDQGFWQKRPGLLAKETRTFRKRALTNMETES